MTLRPPPYQPPHPPPCRLDAAHWRTEVHRDEAAWDALREDWDDLYRRARATPFQTWAWNAAWWRHYGRRGRLRLVTVRRDGGLVALAPLMMRWRHGHRVLTPPAAGQSDHTDVLLDAGHAEAAAGHLAGALLAEPGWDVLDFPEVMPNGAVSRLADRWPRPGTRAPSSVCLRLPACEPGEFPARFPRRTAGKVRARLRKIEARGLDVREAAAAEAQRAVGDMLRLHARQWQGRGINPEHARPRFAAMLGEAATEMIASGQAALTEYRQDGRLVASDLAVIGPDWVGAYLYGAEPGLRDGMDVALMLLGNDLRLACRSGVPFLSLLRGEEGYKLKWRPDLVRNERIVLCRSVRSAGYLGVVAGRSRLTRWRRAARTVRGA
ncbi:GNAT family N-acetyltransferase [Actinomadura logoneensis]|uniref:GNAT family N-acetyltransferase n=1 Tax=Actinomadura logoneensis TaxID=2293572 RepID=A0A372JJU6_9ACTN|nr:GNAT family N-acetyltransferase [Actinomadura logoneensis]RFU40199.1 GNAT family N-acetyltransferase [Actinomadura logoneensis]